MPDIKDQAVRAATKRLGEGASDEEILKLAKEIKDFPACRDCGCILDAWDSFKGWCDDCEGLKTPK